MCACVCVLYLYLGLWCLCLLSLDDRSCNDCVVQGGRAGAHNKAAGLRREHKKERTGHTHKENVGKRSKTNNIYVYMYSLAL